MPKKRLRQGVGDRPSPPVTDGLRHDDLGTALLLVVAVAMPREQRDQRDHKRDRTRREQQQNPPHRKSRH